MTRRWAPALLAAVLAAGVVAGCSEDDEPAPAPAAEPSATPTPVYDPSLPSAAAVMALVPAGATTLTVTDFDQARLDLGFPEMSSSSPEQLRRSFERRSARESVLLDDGLLRPAEAGLVARYGLGQDDVAYEAHFTGPAGEGWVLKLHQQVDMDRVRAAVEAGAGPLDGATVYGPARVVAVGIVLDAAESWAADPSLAGYVAPTPATSTYLQRGCLPFAEAFGAPLEDDLAPAPASDLDALQPLEGFSVTFGASLVTARLGVAREDVFDRARLAENLPRTRPDFALGFANPVADPSGGRIGYRIGRPGLAARLVADRNLPFAVCAE